MKSLILIAVAALAGCAQTSPQWESSFGDASRQLRAAQVIDPAAPNRNRQVAGTDGKAAAGAMKAYAESYGYAVKEAKQPAVSVTTTGSR
jgi:type IV pilus biogenesis protein CpaD/CtpE